MAIVVLVLWLFTAGAGFYLLVTSNLGRARPAQAVPAPAVPAAQAAPVPEPAEASRAPAQAPVAAAPRAAGQRPAAAPAQAAPATAQVLSKREMRRAARDRFDPPSLTAAKNAPVVPGLRFLLEFAHPASGIVGLGFWLGYTFVHYRALGWIAFGLVTATACLGLSWLRANVRAARRRPEQPPDDEPAPSFSTRLAVLHGGAAAVTLALAALTIVTVTR